MADYRLVLKGNDGLYSKALATGVSTEVINADGTVNATVVIDDGSVTLAKLDTAIASSHVTKFAGNVTWTGGGATLATTIAGVLSTDIVIVNFVTTGTEGTILSAVPTADTVTFTLDTANTSNDAVIAYQVLRATA